MAMPSRVPLMYSYRRAAGMVTRRSSSEMRAEKYRRILSHEY
jgi:hypothetical protein